jgi:hypothetical protein
MKRINIILLVITIISISLMASQCNRDPQGDLLPGYPTPIPEEEEIVTEEPTPDPTTEPTVESLDWLEDVTMDEFTEAIDQEMTNLAEVEKQAILDKLAGMSAEELNEAINKVMDKLDDEEKEKFIAWLKEHYLIYQNATIDKWQLPTTFSVPQSMDWPAGIPLPGQGSVSIVSQGGDVTQITLVNMTQQSYTDWEAKFNEEWRDAQGLFEYFDQEKEKYTEYVGNNTTYNLGPNSQTTLELFTSSGRLGADGTLQGRLFGDEHMSKWLELAYGQNMATLTFNGDFNAGGTE